GPGAHRRDARRADARPPGLRRPARRDRDGLPEGPDRRDARRANAPPHPAPRRDRDRGPHRPDPRGGGTTRAPPERPTPPAGRPSAGARLAGAALPLFTAIHNFKVPAAAKLKRPLSRTAAAPRAPNEEDIPAYMKRLVDGASKALAPHGMSLDLLPAA